MEVSQKLKNAVKLSPKKAYEIAHEAGLHPSTLSRIVCGIERIKPNDFRVLRIAKVLDMEPEKCFDVEMDRIDNVRDNRSHKGN